MISEAVMGVATQTQLAGPIDRKGRDMLASLVRASRQDPSVWWAADDMIWEGWRRALSQERCGCGYSREGLTGEKCPECGRVPDIGLNHVLRGMQLIVIDEEDLVHQKQLDPVSRREARQFWARLVLFLRSDIAGAECIDQPARRGWNWREIICLSGAVACFPPFSFMLFGVETGLLLLPLIFIFWCFSQRVPPATDPMRMSDIWPFASQTEFARAKSKPRLLNGASTASA